VNSFIFNQTNEKSTLQLPKPITSVMSETGLGYAEIPIWHFKFGDDALRQFDTSK
jgi:hypothetical protein